MSLRVRLILVIVALVTVVAAALSVLHLDSLANRAFGRRARSERRRQPAGAILRRRSHSPAFGRIRAALRSRRHGGAVEPRSSPAIRTSPTCSKRRMGLIAGNCRDQRGRAERDHPRVIESGARRQTHRAAEAVQHLGRRCRCIAASATCFCGAPIIRSPRRWACGENIIFNIQVVASSVLLRAQLTPQVQWLAIVSGSALLVSLSDRRVCHQLAAAAGAAHRADHRPDRAGEFRDRSDPTRIGQGIRGGREQAEPAGRAISRACARKRVSGSTIWNSYWTAWNRSSTWLRA